MCLPAVILSPASSSSNDEIGMRSQFGVGDDHLRSVDSKAYAGCEGDEVVEGHNLVYVGVRGAGRNDGRAGSFTRRYQMVLAK